MIVVPVEKDDLADRDCGAPREETKMTDAQRAKRLFWICFATVAVVFAAAGYVARALA